MQLSLDIICSRQHARNSTALYTLYLGSSCLQLTGCKDCLTIILWNRSFAFAVPLPTTIEMQKEFGEQLVACGLVGAAMEVFERLELWDNLLICYRLLEKIPQALALVRKRLEVHFRSLKPEHGA